MKIAVLLVLLSVSARSTSSHKVVGYVGQNVTLSCTYNAKLGQLHACWGRGTIPASGCSQQLISSDGHMSKEGTTVSSRYYLLGRLDQGDVSLTILNITEADAGCYGCRVEIPGWFNDDKRHFNLVVMEATHSTMSTTATTASEMVPESVPVSTRAVQLTYTNTPMTSSLGPLQAETNGAMTALLVCVVFGSIVILTVVGVLVVTRKCGPLSKISPSQQVNTLAQFSSVSFMVENVYQIDVGQDGGEYEDVP